MNSATANASKTEDTFTCLDEKASLVSVLELADCGEEGAELEGVAVVVAVEVGDVTGGLGVGVNEGVTLGVDSGVVEVGEVTGMVGVLLGEEIGGISVVGSRVWLRTGELPREMGGDGVGMFATIWNSGLMLPESPRSATM